VVSLRLLAAQGRGIAAFVPEVPMGTTVLSRAVVEGVVHEPTVDQVSDSACWLIDPASIASQAAVALRSGDGVVGVLAIGSPRRRTLTASELERLGAIADQASLALQNSLLHEELARLSVTDRLTELYNHGYFQSRLEQELARARRFDHRVALAMLDIDDFKSFNDSFGHPRGDAVLREVSRIVRATMRDMDIAARYGGGSSSSSCRRRRPRARWRSQSVSAPTWPPVGSSVTPAAIPCGRRSPWASPCSRTTPIPTRASSRRPTRRCTPPNAQARIPFALPKALLSRLLVRKPARPMMPCSTRQSARR
jgi:hypothetical protein